MIGFLGNIKNVLTYLTALILGAFFLKSKYDNNVKEEEIKDLKETIEVNNKEVKENADITAKITKRSKESSLKDVSQLDISNVSADDIVKDKKFTIDL